MALFQPPARPAGHVHVEFKAGRMDWDGKTVTADKRKGKVALFTSEEEQLTHFQWFDREKGEAPLDLIVINDAYFEKIDACKTGRVYLLRFTSSDKKLFFWMQEPKSEGDAELMKKFNEAIGAKIPEKRAPGAAPPAARTQVTPSIPSLPTGDLDPRLRAVLQQFLASGDASGSRSTPIPLSAVLTTEVLTGLLDDEQAVAEMTSLLPDSHTSPEGLREVLVSPQLQQSLSSLSQAVHSDQLPVLLAGLGLDPGAIASAQPGSDALEVLCQAMEAQSGSGTSTGNAPGPAGPPPSS